MVLTRFPLHELPSIFFFFRVFKLPPKATFAKLKAKEPALGPMSKLEIQSWVSTASTGDSSNGNGDQQIWQRDRVLADWPRSLEYAQNVLLNGKTKARTEFLHDEILSLAQHGGSNFF